MSQCRRRCIDEKRSHCHLTARAVDKTLPLLRYPVFALSDAFGNISRSCRDAPHSGTLCDLPIIDIALDQPCMRSL